MKVMKRTRAIRRSIALLTLLIAVSIAVLQSPDFYQTTAPADPPVDSHQGAEDAMTLLNSLAVIGRAPKTGYTRDMFGDGWQTLAGCDTRNTILRRDLTNTVINSKCQVVSGSLNDPYTGKTVMFQRGETSSLAVQIDHVVALSDAWQKGAQQLTPERRVALANDPLELLAVDGAANQQKGDGDAATWLPPNRSFRCQYVARQIAVKKKYALWVTSAEKEAIARILQTCPGQRLPVGYVLPR
jgi:hypothetical protein